MNRTMNRTMTGFVFAGLCATVVPANGQYMFQAYHHRSTVHGDYFSGLADYVQAQGAYNYQTALAYEAYMRAERQRYELSAAAFAANAERIAQRKAAKKAHIDSRREASLARAASRREAAWTWVEDVQLGNWNLPPLLQDPRFRRQVAEIETILQRLSQGTRIVDGESAAELQQRAEELRNSLRQVAKEAPPSKLAAAFKVARLMDSLLEPRVQLRTVAVTGGSQTYANR